MLTRRKSGPEEGLFAHCAEESVIGKSHGRQCETVNSPVQPTIRRRPGDAYLNEEMLMTRRTLILGLTCLCCLLETGTAAAVNNRTQKLLETQSTNAQSTNGGASNSNSPSNVNARPNYGPTNGVFGVPPTTNRTAAGTVPPPKK